MLDEQRAPPRRTAPGPASTASGSGSPTAGPGRSGARRAARCAAVHVRGAGRLRAPPTATPRVYGCAGASNSSPWSRDSTILPRCITATRSATWRTTERSCAMNRYGEGEARLQVGEQVEDLRLDRHVERARPARRARGDPARARARGRCPHAAAARPTARVGSDAMCSAPSPTSSKSSGTRAATSRRRLATTSGSATIAPAVIRGSSDAYGSWNTICTRRP